MNKKDVEHIGYVLGSSHSLEEAKCRLIEWDSRIGDEYETFEAAEGRDEAIDEKVSELMVERYGSSWSLLREKPPYGAVLEEVRREVYGDDYDYIFKKK